MAAYLIYIPGGKGCDAQSLLTSVGIESLGVEGMSFAEALHDTPDGGVGAVGSWSGPDLPVIATSRVLQEWKSGPEVDDKPQYWIGIEKERPVSPVDIQRPQQYTSQSVIVSDGTEWLVPVITKFPRSCGINMKTGRFQTVVDNRYQDICQRGEEYGRALGEWLERIEKLRMLPPGLADEVVSQSPDKDSLVAAMSDERNIPIQIELEAAWYYVIDLLALNYRLTREIAALLGIMTNDQEVFLAVAQSMELVLLATLRQKKIQDTITLGMPGTSNSISGAAVSPPTISQLG